MVNGVRANWAENAGRNLPPFRLDCHAADVAEKRQNWNKPLFQSNR